MYRNFFISEAKRPNGEHAQNVSQKKSKNLEIKAADLTLYIVLGGERIYDTR
jgi:hypothetical protein